MAKSKAVSSNEVKASGTFRLDAEYYLGGYSTVVSAHKFRAEWIDGKGIVVRDENGIELGADRIRFAGTLDNRTVSAYVEGVGYIGGWQYPHKALPWKRLVDYINRGLAYWSSEQLPKRYQQEPRK